MIRWSFQLAQGWEPVAPSASPSGSTSADELDAALGERAATSRKVSTRPVLISTSEAISSPARCGSSGVPAAAAMTSSNRLTRSSDDGVEERELLLDRDGQVGARLEALARLAQELVGGNALRLAHGAER